MLAPQFSLKSILAATVVCAFISLIGAVALHGAAWAMAVLIAIAALGFILAMQGLMFFIMWLFSLVLPGTKTDASGQSPFAPSPKKDG